MPSPRSFAAAAAAALFALAGCGDDGDDAGSTTSTSRRSTTSTTASTTTTTTEPTTTTAAQDTGVRSPEDTAAFVLTAWLEGDRDRAALHADATALDSLFAEDGAAVAGSIEFVQCDSADLEVYDCFFTAEGRVLIMKVEDLRVTATSFGAE